VQASAVSSTAVMEVRATAADPRMAGRIADTFAEEYLASRREEADTAAEGLAKEVAQSLQRVRERVSALDEQLSRMGEGDPQLLRTRIDRDQALITVATLQAQHDALVEAGPVAPGVGEILQHAPPSGGSPISRYARNGLLGMLVSLPVGFGLALLKDSLADTVRTTGEVEELTGARTLALVPLDPRWREGGRPYLASREDPASETAHAYRVLRVALESGSGAQRPRSVLITSPGRSEGKSATAANLALAFAGAGRRTLLISGDLRRPRLEQFFRVAPEPGLSDLLGEDGVSWDRLPQIRPDLRLVPSGGATGDSPGELGREGAASRILAVAEGADITLLDTAPVLEADEVVALAPGVDGVLLVARAGRTGRAALSRAAEQIRQAGGRLLGVVLIGGVSGRPGVRTEDGSLQRSGPEIGNPPQEPRP
ncbi:MAG: hypothetical protein ACREKK_11550, partial [Candidatus Methylomirabilales bacterium]